METYSLLISIVPRNCGEILTHAAVSAGSNGGTILMGRGTASNAILSMLGFGDTAKDVVLIVVLRCQLFQCHLMCLIIYFDIITRC